MIQSPDDSIPRGCVPHIAHAIPSRNFIRRTLLNEHSSNNGLDGSSSNPWENDRREGRHAVVTPLAKAKGRRASTPMAGQEWREEKGKVAGGELTPPERG